MHDLQTSTNLQPIFAFQALQWFLIVNGARLQQLCMRLGVELEWRATIPTDMALAELGIHPLHLSNLDSVSPLCSHVSSAAGTGPLLSMSGCPVSVGTYVCSPLQTPRASSSHHPELPTFRAYHARGLSPLNYAQPFPAF